MKIFKNRIKPTGFTLVELLVSCAILSILITLAIPSYQHYWLQVYRTDALRELTRLANLQQEYYSEHYQYTLKLKSVFGADTKIENSYVLNNGFYAISIESDDLQRSFNLYATAVHAQKHDDACYKIQLTSLGEKSAKTHTGVDVTQTCWY